VQRRQVVARGCSGAAGASASGRSATAVDGSRAQSRCSRQRHRGQIGAEQVTGDRLGQDGLEARSLSRSPRPELVAALMAAARGGEWRELKRLVAAKSEGGGGRRFGREMAQSLNAAVGFVPPVGGGRRRRRRKVWWLDG
jgi:hypothetical protein